MITRTRDAHSLSVSRCGLTIVELLVIVAIICIVIGMTLPAVHRTRENLPRSLCMNNLRQIALATLNYESAYMRFPAGTGMRHLSSTDSGGQLSALVAILPFLEQGELYNQIANPSKFAGVKYPASPPLYEAEYAPWRARIPTFQCPSLSDLESGIAPTHYGFCIGDRARNIATPSSQRGPFAAVSPVTFAEITDGSSNTILVGEIGSNVVNAVESPFAINQESTLLDKPRKCFALVDKNKFGWDFRVEVPLSVVGRGGHWADGRAGVAFFNTILPPGSPSAAVRGSLGVDGIYSASGPHPDGVAVALMDGSTRMISTSIDSGDLLRPTPTVQEMSDRIPSPYGVWGALGTINGGDVADEF